MHHCMEESQRIGSEQYMFQEEELEAKILSDIQTNRIKSAAPYLSI